MIRPARCERIALPKNKKEEHPNGKRETQSETEELRSHPCRRRGGKDRGDRETERQRRITILRAVHKYKDSREQFERRTHKRLVDIQNPQAKTVEALMSVELPAGVEIEIENK